MNEVLTFANTASPLAILAVAVLGLIYAIYKLSRGENILSKISGTQDRKYPEIEKHLIEIEEAYLDQKKFRENHSMHEIPEIVNTLTRLEGKVDKMADAQYSQGLDIARLKALSEK